MGLLATFGPTTTPRSRRGLATVALGAVLTTALAGCAHDAQPPAGPASPFAECSGLTAAPGAAPSGAAASGGAASSGAAASGGVPGGAVAGKLPDVTLACFTGGQPVRLAAVRGPAVINLWATWCPPCRTELPAMQRLADRAGDRLWVVGVDTGDERDAAASFGADTGVALPTLFDPDKTLMTALRRPALPVTVFVDGAGRTFVYNAAALDDAQLARLVREHTGVTVAG
jgi:cytochrome c biogenesis protein CcmG, thiol:disulfide interchange protein DsbE